MSSHLFAAARILSLRTVARRLPWFVLLCAALPGGAADYEWYGSDDLLGGNNNWNTTNTYWMNSGVRAVWPNANATTARAVFGGTQDAPFTVTIPAGSTINANALWFQNTYTLAAGNTASTLNFVGTAPTIRVDAGLTATTHVAVTGTAVTLTGGGTWALGTANRLGDSLGLMVDGGSTFSLGGNAETVGKVTLLAGTLAGTAALTTTASFDLLSGTANVALAGSGRALNKYGAGTVVLNGANTYTGATNVSEGTLRLGAANRIDNSSALNVTGGTFDLGTYSERVGAVTLTSGSIIGTGGASLRGSSYLLQSGTVSAGLGGGSGALTKSSSGSVTLSGSSTYTGATRINGGSLVLTGSLSALTAGGSAVTVNSGGVFAGTGNAARHVIVNSGGILSPGVDGVGRFATGAETWNGGGAYDWNISSPTGVAGANWDLLAITGNLTVNATTGNRFILNVTGSGALPATTLGTTVSWQIATYTGAFNGGFSPNEFTINLGGTWAELNSSYQFAIAQGADAHSLYLTMAVPEPQDYAMILGVITLGLVGYRRWRRLEQLA